jgi:tetratricopeptide (TPR) repeat protein
MTTMNKLNRTLLPAVAAGAVLCLLACEADKPLEKVAKKPAVTAAVPEAPAPTALPDPAEPPEGPAPAPKPESYDELMARARASKKPDEAIEIYLEAAQARPESARPHIAVAALLIGQGEAKLAHKHARVAVELEPKRSRCWNTLGRAELAGGKLAAAEKAFLEATRLSEGNIYAWNNLGLTRIKQKKYEAAVEALEKATAGKGVRAYMFNNLGLALERQDRVDEALEAYKSGLALGSGAAGQNFVRLERELQREEETAVAPPPPAPAKATPPSES